MNKKILIIVIFTAITLLIASQVLAQPTLTPVEELGQFLYFDENLSEPAGQSCASCHDPGFGFVDPDAGLPVSEGVIPGLFGGRNSPSSAYAMYAPVFHFDGELWIGGQFWDGRATGEDLGDPLADQALGPFLNPVEMANSSKYEVVRDAFLNETYGALFDQVCGPVVLSGLGENVEDAYDCIALSIAAFERTQLFGQFNSKYDFYLQGCLAAGGLPNDCAQGIGLIAEEVGTKIFSKKEWSGFQLFMGDAMCAACHVADWIPAAEYAPLTVQVPAWAPAGMVPPVFTDFSYDNLGVPKSDHPLLVNNPVDNGLGSVKGADENGKFKVMTLRNIQLTKPYAHNGYFKTLADITHFYNTRDFLDKCEDVSKPKPGENCWPLPEVTDNVNSEELGNLGLSATDEDHLVKFMKTLTDGYIP